MRLYEITMSAGGALFASSYSLNRVLRAFIYDPPGAFLRMQLGWDSVAGMAAMTTVNMIAFDGASSSTWNETSGTRWGRDSLLLEMSTAEVEINNVQRNLGTDLKIYEDDPAKQKELREGAQEKIDEALAKLRKKLETAGRSMSPQHLLMDHVDSREHLWAAKSITRAFNPPVFPQMVNVHLFLDIYRLLMDHNTDLFSEEKIVEMDGGKPAKGGRRNERRRLTEGEFNVMLHLIKSLATDTNSFHMIRPLLQALVLSRGSPRFGGRINAFLDDYEWILETLDVDIAETEKMRHAGMITDIKNDIRKVPWLADRLGIGPEEEQSIGPSKMKRINRKEFKRAINTSFGAMQQMIAAWGREPLDKQGIADIYRMDPYDTTEPLVPEQTRPEMVGGNDGLGSSNDDYAEEMAKLLFRM